MAKTAGLCGRCGQPLATGARVQLVTLSNVKRIGLRCERCADPHPALVDVTPPAPVALDLTRVGAIEVPDWTARKLGEAE